MSPEFMKKAVIGVLVCVVLFCAFGAGRLSGLVWGPSTPEHQVEPPGGRDQIPFDLDYVTTKGGWQALSPREKAWGRAQYLHTLRGLIRRCEYRRTTAIALHQGKAVSELSNVLGLLKEALTRIENDPSSDPTLEQALINDVNIALRKP
jgi:hypothetical protein